jgi:DNA-binding response OmpR family regulator
VLLVEDEMMVAMLIEDQLETLGHRVVGRAQRVVQGCSVAREVDADLAIVDVNLDGEVSFTIVEVLVERGVPFIFATGYGAAGLLGRYPDAIVLTKPFDVPQLEAAIWRSSPAPGSAAGPTRQGKGDHLIAGPGAGL